MDHVDASCNHYTVRGLKPGTDYYFRVAAENMLGAAPPLSLEHAVVPRSAYSEYSRTRQYRRNSIFGCF